MLSALTKLVLNQIGFKTDRKLVVICSDDWGSLRLKNYNTREKLKSLGLNLDSNRFDRFDCLETNEDVELLFEVLSSYKDYKGNYPVLTALTNVANPDFEKVKSSDYKNYYYEDISQTYQRYPGRDKVLQLFREGIEKKIFIPQFHGREHLQITPWMNALESGDIKTRKAFDHDFFFLAKSDINLPNISGEFAESFNFWNESELSTHSESINSGLRIFSNLFQYSAKLFTAPVLIYHNDLNKILSEREISIIDVPKLRSIPIGKNKYRKVLSYLGQQNYYGQTYINRNSVFETNLRGSDVESCLSQIRKAFSYRQPAIISNHRASFVGGVDKTNRTNGLRQLNRLLKSIMKQWPTVEFIDMIELEIIMKREV